ncbi:MAG TPA: hypothetical protein VFI61_02305 [Patescibacteria group bacterium]|nr:hypothetical protein [Patescibacteria group bacterium]
MIYKVLEPEFSPKFDIDEKFWKSKHKFGISGCFRLRNEAEFMEESILSHLPYLDEVVLAVQPSEDDTQKIAQRLASRFKKIKLFKYPVATHFIDHPDFATDRVNSIYSFVYFSNWALSKCKYTWIAKTEGDVICLNSFEDIVKQIKSEPDVTRYYGRYILNVAGKNCDKISLQKPRNHGLDEAVFNNNPDLYHFEHGGKWEVIKAHDVKYNGFSALHLKRCKRKHQNGFDGEDWIPFTRKGVAEALVNYNSKVDKYRGPDNALGPNCLFEKQKN